MGGGEGGGVMWVGREQVKCYYVHLHITIIIGNFHMNSDSIHSLLIVHLGITLVMNINFNVEFPGAFPG